MCRRLSPFSRWVRLVPAETDDVAGARAEQLAAEVAGQLHERRSGGELQVQPARGDRVLVDQRVAVGEERLQLTEQLDRTGEVERRLGEAEVGAELDTLDAAVLDAEVVEEDGDDDERLGDDEQRDPLGDQPSRQVVGRRQLRGDVVGRAEHRRQRQDVELVDVEVGRHDERRAAEDLPDRQAPQLDSVEHGPGDGQPGEQQPQRGGDVAADGAVGGGDADPATYGSGDRAGDVEREVLGHVDVEVRQQSLGEVVDAVGERLQRVAQLGAGRQLDVRDVGDAADDRVQEEVDVQRAHGAEDRQVAHRQLRRQHRRQLRQLEGLQHPRHGSERDGEVVLGEAARHAQRVTADGDRRDVQRERAVLAEVERGAVAGHPRARPARRGRR